MKLMIAIYLIVATIFATCVFLSLLKSGDVYKRLLLWHPSHFVAWFGCGNKTFFLQARSTYRESKISEVPSLTTSHAQVSVCTSQHLYFVNISYAVIWNSFKASNWSCKGISVEKCMAAYFCKEGFWQFLRLSFWTCFYLFF